MTITCAEQSVQMDAMAATDAAMQTRIAAAAGCIQFSAKQMRCGSSACRQVHANPPDVTYLQ